MRRIGRRSKSLIALAALSVTVFAGTACEQAKEQSKQTDALLPLAMEKAVRDSFPGAELAKLEADEEAGIKIYDVELKADRGEIEVAEDGTILEISTIVQMTDLPKPAADAIQKAAADAQAEIRKIEKSETRAEVGKEGEKGKIVKLTPPRYAYEVEFLKDGKTGEIEVAPDGTIVEPLKW
jgi:hypothetical protein